MSIVGHAIRRAKPRRGTRSRFEAAARAVGAIHAEVLRGRARARHAVITARARAVRRRQTSDGAVRTLCARRHTRAARRAIKPRTACILGRRARARGAIKSAAAIEHGREASDGTVSARHACSRFTQTINRTIGCHLTHCLIRAGEGTEICSCAYFLRDRRRRSRTVIAGQTGARHGRQARHIAIVPGRTQRIIRHAIRGAETRHWTVRRLRRADRAVGGIHAEILRGRARAGDAIIAAKTWCRGRREQGGGTVRARRASSDIAAARRAVSANRAIVLSGRRRACIAIKTSRALSHHAEARGRTVAATSARGWHTHARAGTETRNCARRHAR